MTKNNVFSKKEMTIEFCHSQGYINIKTNPHSEAKKLINKLSGILNGGSTG